MTELLLAPIPAVALAASTDERLRHPNRWCGPTPTEIGHYWCVFKDRLRIAHVRKCGSGFSLRIVGSPHCWPVKASTRKGWVRWRPGRITWRCVEPTE